MTNYRLDRRFTLPAVGLSLVLAGVAACGAFWLASHDAVSAACAVIAILMVANAVRAYAIPPAVVRTDPVGVRIGGRSTGSRVEVAWRSVENVSVDSERLYLDRGDAGILTVPLAYVGARTDELIREIYDRLNEAHGYRRFELD